MNLYQGVWVALVTPFKDHQIDEPALQSLAEDLVKRGVTGLVPLGTTGEGVTVTDKERTRIIKLCVEAAGKAPVVPGCGTNNTEQSVARVVEAGRLGAAGAMVITPYYNKPGQEGLIAHFTTIAESTDLPLLLYNVPGRTSVNMLAETVEKLAEHPQIAGLKEASGNLDQVGDICARVDGKMNVLSGDDGLTLPILSVGGKGVVSVAAHVIPEAMAELVECYSRGETEKALKLHRRIVPVAKAMFLETNPSPVKAALWIEGKIKNELRLPMLPVRPDTRDRIGEALKQYRQESVADE